MTSSLRVSAAGPLRGTIAPPADKSLTHRGYLLAALARSDSKLIGPLDSEDCLRTRSAIEQLGCRVERSGDGARIIPGPLRSPDGPIDCGNSGTTMRLLAGLLAGYDGLEATFTGDESLNRRPMGRIVEPLTRMGARMTGEYPPVHLVGQNLKGIRYQTPVASAQIKSAILLAGLQAQGVTTVIEPSPSRDHTERLLKALGANIHVAGNEIELRSSPHWDGFVFRLPGDISSAAFLMCAAAIISQSDIVLCDVGINPTRTGILDAIAQAGVRFDLLDRGETLGEPVADLRIRATADLKPMTIGGELIPRLIDEIPILAVLATACQGTTLIKDARELRVKESDRIETVAAGLRQMGARVETFEDGLAIDGPVQLNGAVIDAAGDHRIGMAFAVAGLNARGETTILNSQSISTSYPAFERDLATLQGGSS